MQGRAVSGLIGIVVSIFAALFDFQLIVLQKFPIIFEHIRVFGF